MAKARGRRQYKYQTDEEAEDQIDVTAFFTTTKLRF